MKSKFFIGFLLFFILAILGILWVFNAENANKSEIYVKTGDNLDSVLYNLDKNEVLKNPISFYLANKIIRFQKVYPGKYIITNSMTNRQILNMFKFGNQTEISFRFGNNILPHELYGALDRKFEADSMAFLMAINDSIELKSLGLDKESVLALFWADTYQFSWAIKPIQMVRSFVNEQQRYWDAEKLAKLANTGFKTSKEAYILASIIEKEAVKKEELPIIAGVYINRIRIGMPLQADPTLKYAAGIKSMRRVTGIMETESPYNTYKYAGLPPGPIGIATKSGIEAVLNFKNHDYLFFCAKEDFSGFHNFARTYAEHSVNAKRYREALDKRGIK